MKDPYRILDLAPSATEADIRSAYRRLAGAVHPDRGGETERFLEVQAAFRILGDPELRRRYHDDPEGLFDTELARERLLARRRRRRARLSKLYG